MNQLAEHNIKVICIIPAAGKSSRFKSGNKLMGKKLFVSTPKGTKNIPVEIVKPVFIDPENKRLTS